MTDTYPPGSQEDLDSCAGVKIQSEVSANVADARGALEGNGYHCSAIKMLDPLIGNRTYYCCCDNS